MLNNFKWYRKYKGGDWFKHLNTFQLPCLYFISFWARYGEINRFTKVTEVEKWR